MIAREQSGLDGVEVGVAAQVALIIEVDAHVKNGLTRGEQIGPVSAGAARGANHDVGVADSACQVLRAGMARC